MVYHQFENGMHRIGVSGKVKDDLTKDAPIKWGKWAGYRVPAVLKRSKTTLVAVTEYYRGSVEFPDPSVLYEVKTSMWPLRECN